MCFSPGPNNAMGMATALDKGFTAALPLCCAVGAGAGVSLLLLGFGLGEVFTRFPLIYDMLRYGGALYMLWLAWGISGLKIPVFVKDRARKRGAEDERGNISGEVRAAHEKSECGNGFKPLSFWRAFGFQMVNVKLWLTNILIVSNYVGTGENMWPRFIIAFWLFLFLAPLATVCWAAGGVFLRRFLSSGGMRRANYAFALFLLCSVGLLFV